MSAEVKLFQCHYPTIFVTVSFLPDRFFFFFFFTIDWEVNLSHNNTDDFIASGADGGLRGLGNIGVVLI